MDKTTLPSEKERLLDISEIEVDESLPPKERLQVFLQQLGDGPYRFRSGKLTVELVFDEQGESLEQLLLRQLETL